MNPDKVSIDRAAAPFGADFSQALMRVQADILDASGEETYVFSRDGRFLYSNRAGARAFGLTPEALIGKSGLEVGAPADIVARFDAERERLFTTAEAFQGTISYPTVSGLRDFEYRWTPLLKEDGAFSAALFTARDVTERNFTEAALRESEKRYRSIVDTASEGIWIVDKEYRTTYTNTRMGEMLGYSPEEMLGCHVLDFVFDEDRLLMQRRFAERRDGKKEVYDLRYRRQDGSAVWLLVSTNALLDATGQFTGALAMFTDITERRAVEEALRESEVRLRSVIDTIPSIIYVKDLEGRYTLVNRAFETRNGHTFEKIKGKTDWEVFPPELCGPMVANDKRVIATGVPIEFEESGSFDNKVVTYLSTKFALRDAKGTIYAICGVSTDITHRKQDEIARQFLNEASAVLGSSLDYKQTLQRVADLAVPHIADWCGVDIIEEDGAVSQLAIAHVDPEKVKWGHELRRRYPVDPYAPRGLPNVLRSGKAEIYVDISDELLVKGARDLQHLELIRQLGLNSLMMVPIIARGHTLGAITFVATDESGHRYSEEDLGLAEGLASRAALAIDNARLYQAAQEELVQRRQVQDALIASEERFRFAIANSDTTVYMADRDLRYTWVYRGKASKELTSVYGKSDDQILESDDAARIIEIKERVVRTGVEERHVVRATLRGAEPRYFDAHFAPLQDAAGSIIGVTGTAHDVTQQKQGQDALAQHQAEIEALNVRLRRSMRETHHRVKNNLQIITALVNMQQMQYEDQVPATELQRLTHHIGALASIHDLLTHQAQTDTEVSDISIAEVVAKLMPTVQDMVQGRGIDFDVQDLRLPVRHSTTIAVLVNELVSNALKHGAGEIHVRFSFQGERAMLQVLDEGPGFPPEFDPSRAAHTGLDLIGSLAHMDLRGVVRYENRTERGAHVTVEFPIPEPAKLPGEPT